jgi:serine/threonine protein kinase
VALKSVRIRKTEEGVPKEFVREIESLQRLDHPNIVKI